jgi:hypothetical protein
MASLVAVIGDKDGRATLLGLGPNELQSHQDANF